MRLIIGNRPLDARACARWAKSTPTSDVVGPVGAVFDRYAADAQSRPGETPDATFERVRARIFAYDIFSPKFIRGALYPPGPVAEGTLIVQRAGPLWLSVESAVRVVELWDRSDGGKRSAGFRYVTLTGHPERGWASFEVTLTDDGRVEVVLEARSRAGSALTLLGRPVARLVQKRATRAALKRLVG